jgi:hypothetical protein
MRSAAAIVAVLAAGVLSTAVLAGCSASATGAERGHGATASATPAGRHTPAAKPKPTPKPTQKPKPKPKPAPTALPVAPPNAGALPQTQAMPQTGSAAFSHVIHDFWLAVTTGDPNYAKPAFFPEKAYGQVKAITDPDSDWQGRLWYDFALDLAAVRQLIGKNAKLLRIVVPVQYAVWVPPGACYNNVGYWHAPGSRVVYEQGGVTHSFGIASFISWRGDWYLIHLGALVRASAVGVVDDPETGAGEPGPPGGC